MTKVLQRIIFSIAFGLVSILSLAQNNTAVVSGKIVTASAGEPIPFSTVQVVSLPDSTWLTGVISSENGSFTLPQLGAGKYLLQSTSLGFEKLQFPFTIGQLSSFIDLGTIKLKESLNTLNQVTITENVDQINNKLNKQVYLAEDNSSQAGGSALQLMRNLPSVSIEQDGKILLRGSDKVSVLIDGKQTALTGFGNQAGLDNIPASAIERIEIITNPSSKYDANGNAGIINIIFKKTVETGFNGKIGLNTGVGSLWKNRQNLPSIRQQYSLTPKLNPTVSINYRTKKSNFNFQGDGLKQKAVNKNEYFTRTYSDGTVINQQFLENRSQYEYTAKTGFDYFFDDQNAFSISALFNKEVHVDKGDLPYFNADLSERKRLWAYHENEINTSINAASSFEHKFKQPGHVINFNLNYTFHREDEQMYFTNTYPQSVNFDTTLLVYDESVSDFNMDYSKPLRHGHIDLGSKLRWRNIPTHMTFKPGTNSILDLNAQGNATYNEVISALFANYVYEINKLELEAGMRLEQVNVNYRIDRITSTYNNNGYNYLQPFPSLRVGYTLNNNNKISAFYNRRVDRPEESDLRIFPKYDDPEILKIGNPNVQPQYTESAEIGYKTNWNSGYFYAASYFKYTTNVISRIATTLPNSTLINNISQNTGNLTNQGIDIQINQELGQKIELNASASGYKSRLGAFTINNSYPSNISFSQGKQEIFSGNLKANIKYKISQQVDFQISAMHFFKDVIPQGYLLPRSSVDFAIKKSIQNGKGELFFNVTDLFNTMKNKRIIIADNVTIISKDYYETQVIRLGYNYKF